MKQLRPIHRPPHVRVRALLACAAALASASPAGAQTEGSGGVGPVVMRVKLEKTFLHIDVVALYVRVEGESADWLRQFTNAMDYSEAAADTVTAIVLDADSATVTLRFLRGASLEHFLEEVDGGMRKAVAAGLLSRTDAVRIASRMPQWYAALEQRGVRSGDEHVHLIRGDTMETSFVDAAGNVLLRHDTVGRAERSAVLASYFAPGSDFRAPLVRSLYR